jgi:ribosomal protein L40E
MLINCQECNAQISDKADACPHCGYKKPKPQTKPAKKTNFGCLYLIVFLILLVIFIAQKPEKPSQTIPEQAQHTTPKPDAAQQKKLAYLIQQYQSKGVFSKTEKGKGVARAYVAKLFDVLTVDEKSIVLGVVLTYYRNQDRDVELVSIYDAYTGKHLGRYSDTGLDLN